MDSAYPLVPLGDVLQVVSRPITVQPHDEYRLLGIRLDGRGVYHRETKLGSQSSATTLYRVRTGDFIYSRLFAWRGAFGIVPPEFEEAAVSNEFPIFHPSNNGIDPRYLAWWFRLSTTLSLVEDKCSGSTPLTRNRLKEDALLSLRIPLGTLSEQQRIVGRIEELAGNIEEAKRFRQQSADLIGDFKAAEEQRIWPESSLQDAPALSDVTTFLTRGRQSLQGDSKHFLIKTQHVQMGKYVRTNMTLDAGVASNVAPAAIARSGDILIACSAAGCLGRVAVYDDPERIAATDTHVAIARAKEDVILPEYLYAYLLGAQGQRQIRSREKGDWLREKVGFQLTELNLKDLQQVPVPLPSKEKLADIVTYLKGLHAKVEALQSLQQHSEAELHALLPAVLDRAFRGQL
jgi:type I restriction enzyme S subunit